MFDLTGTILLVRYIENMTIDQLLIMAQYLFCLLEQ